MNYLCLILILIIVSNNIHANSIQSALASNFKTRGVIKKNFIIYFLIFIQFFF